MATRRITLLTLVLGLALAGCGGGGGGAAVAPGNFVPQAGAPTVKSIQVAPGTVNLFAGGSMQLKATATLSDNSTQDVTQTVAWSNPVNFAAAVNASGQVSTSATQTGTTQVTASLQGVSGNTTVNVTAGPDQLYAFRTPTDLAGAAQNGNSDLVVTTSPRTGSLNSPIQFDPGAIIDLNVINTAGKLTPDVTFQVSFAAPAGNLQVCTLQQVNGNLVTTIATFTYNTQQVIPPGAFANNVTFPGDAVATGKFMVGECDDPAYGDMTAAVSFVLNGTALPAAQPKNFFGPNGNCLFVILEAPTARLTPGGSLQVFETRSQGGAQVARAANPFLSFFLLNSADAAFETGLPSTDTANFATQAQATLQAAPYNLTAAQAQTALGGLIPDLLTLDVTRLYGDVTNTGYPNGRRMRDDVVGALLSQLTNGVTKSDGVADDNAQLITDGFNGTVAQFPYVGPLHDPAQ